MTYKEIRKAMVEMINSTLEAYIEELDVEDFVDNDVLHDFMWEKDFGKDLAEAYVNEHVEDLVQDFLEEMYRGIDTDDLSSPF